MIFKILSFIEVSAKFAIFCLDNGIAITCFPTGNKATTVPSLNIWALKLLW